jgi:hypothetical protein
MVWPITRAGYELARVYPKSINSPFTFHILRVIIPTLTKIRVVIISGTVLMHTFAANEVEKVGSLRKIEQTE